jgi:hypothetical protein
MDKTGGVQYQMLRSRRYVINVVTSPAVTRLHTCGRQVAVVVGSVAEAQSC